MILADYDRWTGYSILHEWQMRNGQLSQGYRLVPTIPFVLGGEFTIANLTAMEAVQGMKYRASVARQIHGLPDGSKIKLIVTD